MIAKITKLSNFIEMAFLIDFGTKFANIFIMLRVRLKIYLLAFFAFILFAFNQANACSLALHDWQLVYYIKIPMNAPIIPMGEISILQYKFKKAVTDTILWVVKPGTFTSYINGITSFFDGWAGDARWVVVPDNKSVLKLAKEYAKEENKPVIVGSDKCYLKFAIFLDANSANKCCQIVVEQDNRVRGVFQDSLNPWAQEFTAQSWFSLIFYQVPVPGRILSFSAYPIGGTRTSFYEDHPLVEDLLSKKLLMRRPDLVVDPYAFDFPDLPE